MWPEYDEHIDLIAIKSSIILFRLKITMPIPSLFSGIATWGLYLPGMLFWGPYFSASEGGMVNKATCGNKLFLRLQVTIKQ